MFTGIIESCLPLDAVQHKQAMSRLQISMVGLPAAHTQIGASVAVNGVCLTITQRAGEIAHFDVSHETLTKTIIADWLRGDRVNLEAALTLNTPLGGHLVSGHVDGTAVLDDRVTSNNGDQVLSFVANRRLGRYIASKGSVCLDGISLTTNNVYDDADGSHFSIAAVPHTLKNTTLGTLNIGARVHLEIDQIARYLQRIVETS